VDYWAVDYPAEDCSVEESTEAGYPAVVCSVADSPVVGCWEEELSEESALSSRKSAASNRYCSSS
jgi:hypothetical protein